MYCNAHSTSVFKMMAAFRCKVNHFFLCQLPVSQVEVCDQGMVLFGLAKNQARLIQTERARHVGLVEIKNLLSFNCPINKGFAIHYELNPHLTFLPFPC